MTKSFNDDSMITFQKNIFPPDWKNPKPTKTYDLLIIGGGPGGMTAAMYARSFNASVAIVEKEHFGGECLSYGCIPSKAMLRCARLANEIRHAKEFGLNIENWKIDFKSVMQRVHDIQAAISPHDNPTILAKLGIEVFLGEGHFTGSNTLEVKGQTIKFKKAIIATGTHPIPLNVPGIGPADYLTNQDVFKISSLPPRLGVIGGGPIGCELAQAFSSFGSKVTLITRADSILPREDPIAIKRLQEVFQKEGIQIYSKSKIQRVEKKGKQKILYLENNSESIIVDELLVAIGRQPAVDGLDLEKANVKYDQRTGISVNDYLQTSNPDIYAAGDVESVYKFTHVSKDLSKMAVHNSLKGNQEKSTSLIIPWCTYTEPEVAHIGINEQQAKEKGFNVESVQIEMASVDRAITDGQTTGFAKLLIRTDNNQIVGATLMAAHAGDMISELSVAMNCKDGLMAIAKAIHPFPTQSEVLRKAAQVWFSTHKSEAIKYEEIHV